jgi:hypothetical protein
MAAVMALVGALFGLYGAGYAVTPFRDWAGKECRAPVLAALPGDRDLDNCIEEARDRVRRSGAVLGLDAAGLAVWAVVSLRKRAGAKPAEPGRSQGLSSRAR